MTLTAPSPTLSPPSPFGATAEPRRLESTSAALQEVLDRSVARWITELDLHAFTFAEVAAATARCWRWPADHINLVRMPTGWSPSDLHWLSWCPHAQVIHFADVPADPQAFAALPPHVQVVITPQIDPRWRDPAHAHRLFLDAASGEHAVVEHAQLTQMNDLNGLLKQLREHQIPKSWPTAAHYQEAWQAVRDLQQQAAAREGLDSASADRAGVARSSVARLGVDHAAVDSQGPVPVSPAQLSALRRVVWRTPVPLLSPHGRMTLLALQRSNCPGRKVELLSLRELNRYGIAVDAAVDALVDIRGKSWAPKSKNELIKRAGNRLHACLAHTPAEQQRREALVDRPSVASQAPRSTPPSRPADRVPAPDAPAPARDVGDRHVRSTFSVRPGDMAPPPPPSRPPPPRPQRPARRPSRPIPVQVAGAAGAAEAAEQSAALDATLPIRPARRSISASRSYAVLDPSERDPWASPPSVPRTPHAARARSGHRAESVVRVGAAAYAGSRIGSVDDERSETDVALNRRGAAMT
ncbi:hypothetical protein [Roseateles amylovorans]|uniref:Uncharacterized protein n=1 Tax=Roseateles amylovorans TaxID=2978473 RepID=A0ABY6B1J8_9BURK|nr:hypothetical protein [Roseateles amylovorans]UXH77195.1 hypothetical protein N4261_19575 [Roseateles amylovorans]